MLVEAECFSTSTKRRELWSGLERYLSKFFKLEEEYAAILEDRPLVPYIWLGGSFVSPKLDPENIDLSVIVDDRGAEALKGRPSAQWLVRAFNRKSCLHEYGLSPIEIRYRQIASVFRPDKLPVADQGYLRDRGAWDDWWQRCRHEGLPNGAPTLDTAGVARGYLEVTL